ncbi:MAG: hypothetical protein NTW99_04880 [Chloroflexi bacterium]|nr:hypothetical protein [Chloroflexota bacterium]
MLEKLIENWLDNASERSYQPVFVQMLSARGYRVVHSTRHTALEFGRDVLAIAPDGKGCTYQLKGNPGGKKLNLNQFRNEVQPQLVQLMSQAVDFPGFPSEPHNAYLVSNGYFEEEVQVAIGSLNRMPYYPSKVSLISRGDLLGRCKEFGASLWPGELEDTRILLEIFLSDPKDVLPTEMLSQLISKILALQTPEDNLLGQPGFQRAVTSAALLTGIATSGFAEAENHFAVASAWTLLAISVIAAGEKHGHRLNGVAFETLWLAVASVGDALAQLWNEVKDRKHIVEGNAITDPEVYGWRYTTILGLLSCLALLDESCHLLEDESREKLKQWLLQRHEHVKLWGEGAVANLVPWLVWLRKNDPTQRPDWEIANLTEAVIALNQHKSISPLPGPYYSFEQIARSQMRLDKAGEASAVGRETFAGSAFTAEPLFHLLVRTNLKQTCKNLWPNFTRLAHRVCLPDNAWEYCTLRIASGVDQTMIYPSTYQWAKLQAEALEPRGNSLPTELTARPWLLALWWQVAPYRYKTAASSVFVEGILPGWGAWGNLGA